MASTARRSPPRPTRNARRGSRHSKPWSASALDGRHGRRRWLLTAPRLSRAQRLSVARSMPSRMFSTFLPQETLLREGRGREEEGRLLLSFVYVGTCSRRPSQKIWRSPRLRVCKQDARCPRLSSTLIEALHTRRRRMRLCGPAVSPRRRKKSLWPSFTLDAAAAAGGGGVAKSEAALGSQNAPRACLGSIGRFTRRLFPSFRTLRWWQRIAWASASSARRDRLLEATRQKGKCRWWQGLTLNIHDILRLNRLQRLKRPRDSRRCETLKKKRILPTPQLSPFQLSQTETLV